MKLQLGVQIIYIWLLIFKYEMMKKLLLLILLSIVIQLQAQISPTLFNQFEIDEEFYPQSIAYYNGEIYMPDPFGNRIVKTSATTANAPIITVVSNIGFPTAVQLIDEDLYFTQAFTTVLPTPNTGKLSKINLIQNNTSVEDVITNLNLPLSLTGNLTSLFVIENEVFVDPDFPDDIEFESATISQVELSVSPPIKNILFADRGFILDMKLDNTNLYWTEEFNNSEKLLKYEVSDAMPPAQELYTFVSNDYPERIFIHNSLLYFTSFSFNGSQELSIIRAIDLSDNQLTAFDVSTPFLFNSAEVYLAGMVVNNNDLFISADAYNTSTDEETGLLYKLDISTLSVNQINNLLSLQMFPNPTHDSIYFNEAVVQLQLFDVTGKQVVSFKNASTFFDVSFLSQGMYIVKGKTTNGIPFQQKLVKN